MVEIKEIIFSVMLVHFFIVIINVCTLFSAFNETIYANCFTYWTSPPPEECVYWMYELAQRVDI